MITGAAGGIGQELARQFGECGAAIAALDKKEEVRALASELAKMGMKVHAETADIGDADQVAQAVAGFRQELGSISILVNNAGFSARATLEATTPETWRADVGANLNGAFNCAHAVLADMKAANAGTIVNISSVNGLSALGDPAYSAAKAGMINLTKSLAMEYGRFNIRANAICPGTVRTPIWDHRVKKNPEIFENLLKWYPLRRVADPSTLDLEPSGSPRAS